VPHETVVDGVMDVAEDLGIDLSRDDAVAIVEAVVMDLEMSSPPVGREPAPKPTRPTVDAGLARSMWEVLTGRIQDLRARAGLHYLTRHEIYPEPRGKT
jgi:hypothetical protein